MPGVRGASGSVEATQAGGTLRLASRNATDRLARGTSRSRSGFDTLDAEVRWTRDAARTEVHVDKLAFANPHATGSARGVWRSLPQGPGEIDLTASIPRADVRHLHPYLPRWLQASTRDWVRLGLLQGTGEDARLVLKGDLAQFPFADGKHGTVPGHGEGARRRPRVTPTAGRGCSAPMPTCGSRAPACTSRCSAPRCWERRSVPPAATFRTSIPDLSAADDRRRGARADGGVPALHRAQPGRRAGSTTITDGIEAQGQGLLGAATRAAAGQGRWAARRRRVLAREQPAPLAGVPALREVNGKLVFTERDLRGRDITAEILGGPGPDRAVVRRGPRARHGGRDRQPGAGRRRVAVGVLGARRGQRRLDVHRRRAIREFSAWTIESPLRGATLDLPAPLAKSAAETVPLRIERRRRREHRERGRADDHLREQARGSGPPPARRARRRPHRPDARAGRRAGRTRRAAGRRAPRGLGQGRGARAQRRRLARVVAGGGAGTAARPASGQRGAACPAGHRHRRRPVRGDRAPPQRHPAGRPPRRRRLAPRHPRREVTGTGVWSAATAAAPNGRLVARLARLSVPSEGDLVPWGGAAEARGERKADAGESVARRSTSRRPRSSRGRDLGRLELVAQPQGTDWQIERMALANDGGRLDAEGTWRVAGAQQQTKLDVDARR